MSEEFKQYVISLYQDIPQEVYEGLRCQGTGQRHERWLKANV